MRMSLNGLVIGGLVLAVAGATGLALPLFTTRQTTEVARIGDLKLETTESRTYAIPPLVSGGVLLAGLILVGVGLVRRQ